MLPEVFFVHMEPQCACGSGLSFVTCPVVLLTDVRLVFITKHTFCLFVIIPIFIFCSENYKICSLYCHLRDKHKTVPDCILSLWDCWWETRLFSQLCFSMTFSRLHMSSSSCEGSSSWFTSQVTGSSFWWKYLPASGWLGREGRWLSPPLVEGLCHPWGYYWGSFSRGRIACSQDQPSFLLPWVGKGYLY